MQTVVIKEDLKNHRIKVKFDYNRQIIYIMQKHRGYFNRRNKTWIFPHMRLTKIVEDLEEKHHRVKIIPDKRIKKLIWQDKNTVSVLGYCKKCKEYAFIGRDGLCVKCR